MNQSPGGSVNNLVNLCQISTLRTDNFEVTAWQFEFEMPLSDWFMRVRLFIL